MPALEADVPIPVFEIIFNGSALPVVPALHVVYVGVEEDTELPGMFSLEIVASDDLEDEFVWVDDESIFAVGNPVEVKMGYADDLVSMFKGEITGLEPSFHADRLPSLIVRGYDRRHRLARGRHTRSFVKMKDSDIASEVASAAGLTPRVIDSIVLHEYVLQADRTDFEFLLERAGRINYEVFVEDKTLHFRPAAHGKDEVLTLKADEDLTEFNPRLSSAGQMSEVSVRGWDPKNKKAIVGKSHADDVASMSEAKRTGAALSWRAFGDAVELSSLKPVAAQDEADQMARAQLDRASLGLITGEAACIGRTDLRPGKVVKIDGVGKRFGGRYYITAASHVFEAGGYTTRFSFRRNSL